MTVNPTEQDRDGDTAVHRSIVSPRVDFLLVFLATSALALMTVALVGSV